MDKLFLYVNPLDMERGRDLLDFSDYFVTPDKSVPQGRLYVSSIALDDTLPVVWEDYGYLDLVRVVE